VAIGNNADIVAAAAGDNAAMLRVLKSHEQAFGVISDQVGISLISTDPTPQPMTLKQSPNWTVDGQDGHFHVVITPLSADVSQQAGARNVAAPGGVFAATNARIGRKAPLTYPPGTGVATPSILFHVQSSLNTQFNANGSVVDYGPSDQLEYQITDHPNEIRFWRIRFRTQSSDFGDWFPLTGPGGWVGVASGVLRSTSAAPNMALNTTNNTTVDSSDNGVNDNINIHGPGGAGTSWIHFDGQLNQTIVPAGVIIGVPRSVQRLTVYDPVNKYQAFDPATQLPSALQDLLFWAGLVTTVAAGGGGGVPGGRGAGGPGRLTEF
jgi:hypothetical protein